jgi:hypothetical protein
LSSGCGCLHEAEELPGGVSLEAAADLGIGLLLCAPPGQVMLGGGVVKHPPVGDDVQCAVELAVTEAVELDGAR